VNSTHAAILGQLETRTEDFRFGRAARHRSKAREARAEYAAAVDGWIARLAASMGVPLPRRRGRHEGDAYLAAPLEGTREALSTQRWHDQRARGQEARFARLRLCGTRTRLARCGWCGEDGKPVPEGCGVSRLCARCSLQFAKRRRARFGRARARALLDSARAGVTRKRRAGGRYTEKMLTLTVPHVTIEQIERRSAELTARALRRGDGAPGPAEKRRLLARARAASELARRAQGSDVKLRIDLLWRAWPRFRRLLVAHLELRGEHLWSRLHRAFEWTPGNDGAGHPHFHCWLWSPMIPWELVAIYWTAALLDEGAPLPTTTNGYYRTDLKVFRAFDGRAVSELLKGGRREALTLSRLYQGKGPGTAFDYSDGWTIAEAIAADALPGTVADLYEALEGKRLTQASRGFFEENEPARCPCCEGKGAFTVRFEHRPPADVAAPLAPRQKGPEPPS
jgi:hypothetical protein